MKFAEQLKLSGLNCWGVEEGTKEWFSLVSRVNKLDSRARKVFEDAMRPYSEAGLGLYDALIVNQVPPEIAAETVILFPDLKVFNQNRRVCYFTNRTYRNGILQALFDMAEDFIPQGNHGRSENSNVIYRFDDFNKDETLRSKYKERLGRFKKFVESTTGKRVA